MSEAQSVVGMLNGLIDAKNLQLQASRAAPNQVRRIRDP